MVQSGWNNRYRFPHPDVTQRYSAAGSRLLDSKYGAVTLRFGEEVVIDQYQSELTGKRDTALQWWLSAL